VNCLKRGKPFQGLPVGILCLFLALVSCCKVQDTLSPQICCTLQEKQLESLPSPFPPLSVEEKRQSWGKEYAIALAFAKECDLYRALSTFKRAEILIPPRFAKRKLEIQYFILFCYYLGKKFAEAIHSFDHSGLSQVDKSFPVFQDLLIMLYESYRETLDTDKANRILEILQTSYPETAGQLQLSFSLVEADLPQIRALAAHSPLSPSINQMLSEFSQEKKSVRGAQFLNTILPGSGYLYLGQRRSALTAFLLNGLFIAAIYEFFHNSYIAAGIITASFEMGWYFGGIYGAGEEAKFYNEHLYEQKAGSLMNQNKLFPLFMLHYAF
jgi:hypothetical protein